MVDEAERVTPMRIVTRRGPAWRMTSSLSMNREEKQRVPLERTRA
jgi:hypothetical protein